MQSRHISPTHRRVPARAPPARETAENKCRRSRYVHSRVVDSHKRVRITDDIQIAEIIKTKGFAVLRIGKVLAAFGFAVLLPVAAFAQATISGVVKDASG